MIEFLFLDLDDTILDFHRAERIALSKTFREFGLEPTDTVLNRYHEMNIWYWQQLEKGSMDRIQVLEGRFRALFSELGIEADAAAVNACYEENLCIGHYFLPGAEEAVGRLSKKYRLFIASNGSGTVQHARLTSAGLYPMFENVFISQDIGFDKPSEEYFSGCFSKIPGFDPSRAMIVGDSLTSDILGGIRSGMRTCWINPTHADRRPDIQPDYEIEALSQLETLLGSLPQE